MARKKRREEPPSLGVWLVVFWPITLLVVLWAWNQFWDDPGVWIIVLIVVGAAGLAATAFDEWVKHQRAAKQRFRFEPAVRRRPAQLEWAEMMSLAGYRCFYCGQVQLARNLHAEHVVPVVRGGVSLPLNIVVACSSCNLRKRTMTGREFVAKPTAEQAARFRAIDEMMSARRISRRERKHLYRAHLERRSLALEKRRADRRAAEKAAWQAKLNRQFPPRDERDW